MLMESSISDRIKFLLTKNQITASELAEKLGYSSPEKILRLFRDKKNKPSIDLISDIGTIFNVDFNWLIKGEENKFVCDIKEKNSKKQTPLIPINAMAGNFQGEKEIMEYDCEFYSVPGMDKADYFIRVQGMSMFPTYNNGDIVACRRINIQDAFFQWNRVYVLDTDQGPILKRIKPGSEKEHITIVSDNPDFEPFELHLSQIYHIALVLGCIKLE